MTHIAWDESNLVVLYNEATKKVCDGCCTYAPDLCCPGFGDGGTPLQYTVEIEGVTDCAGAPTGYQTAVNGVWVLDLVECAEEEEEPSCQWVYKEAEEDGNVWISFHRAHTIGCAEIGVSAFVWYNGSWRSVFSSLDRYRHGSGWCDNVDNRWVSCVLGRYGKNGTADFWPLGWPQWVEEPAPFEYFVDNRVTNNNVVYTCSTQHEPETEDAEPGVGGSWPAFWDLSDPCGNAMEDCP